VGRWVAVAQESEIPAGTGKTVRAGAYDLALFNDAGSFFAIDDTCPHQGASLGEGLFHEGRVICPWHAWVYDVRSGQCRGVPGTAVSCYPTRCVAGAIEVELPEATGAAPANHRSGR